MVFSFFFFMQLLAAFESFNFFWLQSPIRIVGSIAHGPYNFVQCVYAYRLTEKHSIMNIGNWFVATRNGR